MKQMMPSISLYATAVLFTTQLISKCVAAPAPRMNGPWVKPCGGGSNSGRSLNHSTNSTQTITECLRSLERISHAGKNQTDSLILALNISSDLRKDLASYPPLGGFPVPDVSFTPGIQIADLVRKELQSLSKIAVFLEGTRLDTSAYSDKIRTIEQTNLDMLCQLYTMLPGRSVTADVSRDIMPTNIRNLIDTTEIDARNYLIMRDVKKVYEAIEESLEAYKEENNN